MKSTYTRLWIHYVEHKSRIECALAQRHLSEGGWVLYDVMSSYVEGKKNHVAAYGYNRDKKKGKKQSVMGLMTDGQGCPIAIEIFSGNTPDINTLLQHIKKIQETFGLRQVVLVGDRGLLKQKHIQEELLPVGLDGITGMQKSPIDRLMAQEKVSRSLFDATNVWEFYPKEYPKERVVLCRNPLQADCHKEQRDALWAKTKEQLDAIGAATQRERRPLKDAAAIALRVGKVVGKYQVRKYFVLDIQEGHFSYRLDEEKLEKARQLDGLYAMRSSLEKEPSAKTLVSHYKRLATVERAFRTIQSLSIPIRPIHHRTENRVIAHVFLCMLAYYVSYHLRKK